MSDCSLCHCHSGSTGIITKIQGNTPALARLQELGLLAGQWIRVIRSGNPTIFEIGDSRYCIRPNQLQGISIQIVPDHFHSTPGEIVLNPPFETIRAIKND